MFFHRLQPLVAPSREDGEALDNVRAIAALLQGAAGLAAFSPPVATAAATTPAGAGAGTSGARAWQLVQEVSQILPELAPGILFTGEHARQEARKPARHLIYACVLSRPCALCTQMSSSHEKSRGCCVASCTDELDQQLILYVTSGQSR